MACMKLKNGVRIHFSDKAFQDSDYMKVVSSEISDNPDKRIKLSPEKEKKFKALRGFLTALKEGKLPDNICVLKDT